MSYRRSSLWECCTIRRTPIQLPTTRIKSNSRTHVEPSRIFGPKITWFPSSSITPCKSTLGSKNAQPHQLWAFLTTSFPLPLESQSQWQCPTNTRKVLSPDRFAGMSTPPWFRLRPIQVQPMNTTSISCASCAEASNSIYILDAIAPNSNVRSNFGIRHLSLSL